MSIDLASAPPARRGGRWLARLLGTTSLPAPPHVFALDARRLRYACFEREGAQHRLVEYRVADLSPDTFFSGPLGGPLRDAESFQRLLGALLSQVANAPRDASLVVPDAWLRIVFTESGDLPRGAAERDEILRWKLRRLVPFRVDELRVEASEVAPFPGQEEPRRLLLGFAVEALLAQLESAFASCGVHLGCVSNMSLSLLSAVAAAGQDAVTALAVVEESGYSLLFARAGEPVLHRHKVWAEALPEEGRAAQVARDLRLTRTFLEERLPEVPLGEVLLETGGEPPGPWLRWLSEGLEREARPLRASELPIAPGETAPAWREAAPLLGTARQEVA